MKKIVLITLFSLCATVLLAQQTITDADVSNASDALIKSPRDTQAWQTFQGIIQANDYPSDVRSRVMFVFAVSHLLQMNTNLFTSALQALRTRYPQEGATLADRLTPDDWLVMCPECGGTGIRKAPYPTAPSTHCLNCSGTGKIFQLGPHVKSQVTAVLGEIKALATENIRFAEQSKKALAEWDPKRRIAALQALVDAYPRRKDLDAVKQALAKTEEAVAKEEAALLKKKKEQALRDQETKDYQAICSNLETLPTSGIPVMLREIDRFIENYPNSVSRLDLEIWKTKLQRREQTQHYLWKGFYICTGLALLALVASSLKALLTRKKKPTGPLPVPGLNQTSEISDPLAGTFSENDPS